MLISYCVPFTYRFHYISNMKKEKSFLSFYNTLNINDKN